MVIEQGPSFDPKSFLAKVGEGRSIGKYRENQVVFSQGDAADFVFYIQKGNVKLTVVSEQGKEACRNSGAGCVLRRGLPDRPATAHGDGYGNDRMRNHATGEGGHCTRSP